MIVVRVLLSAVGVSLVVRAVLSALLTFVLPRGVTDGITRFVFIRMRFLFGLLSLRKRSYEDLDRLWSLFAPVSLLVLPTVWVAMTIAGCGIMYWAVDAGSWKMSFTLSGSSMFTLGFMPPVGTGQTAMVFAQAGIGLGLVAVIRRCASAASAPSSGCRSMRIPNIRGTRSA